MKGIRRRKPVLDREMFIQETYEPRSPYPKGDCCYGCPYRMCPSRPSRPFIANQPNCVWRMFNEKTKK